MDRIETLPIFPLSDVVLLPEVSVPLFIFEPRYRQMTADALAGTHQIGMVTVRPEAVSSMAGSPPVFEIGCLGRIAHAQERPDGTYQLLLVGERRFRILEERSADPERLYRSARVELLDDAAPCDGNESNRLDGSRATLLELLEDLLERTAPADSEAGSETEVAPLAGFEALEPARLVNALAQSISFRPAERQRLLEADSILDRFEIMGDLLRFRLAELGLPDAENGTLPN
jgi:Lon protease-like protein